MTVSLFWSSGGVANLLSDMHSTGDTPCCVLEAQSTQMRSMRTPLLQIILYLYYSKFSIKILRIITEAPCYVSNKIIHEDLKILYVTERLLSWLQHNFLEFEDHPNQFLINLLDNNLISQRLQCLSIVDLSIRFWLLSWHLFFVRPVDGSCFTPATNHINHKVYLLLYFY